jgi:hypothetical protein
VVPLFEEDIQVPVVGITHAPGTGATGVDVGALFGLHIAIHVHDQLTLVTIEEAIAPVTPDRIRTAANVKAAAAFRIGLDLLSISFPMLIRGSRRRRGQTKQLPCRRMARNKDQAYL